MMNWIKRLFRDSKKYEIIKSDSILFNGHTLYRIKALRDIGDIKKGTLGGYIEREYNLQTTNNCWIDSKSKVYGQAAVIDNAFIRDSVISDHAIVGGNAQVIGSRVTDRSSLGDNCFVADSRIYGEATICEDADIHNGSIIHGHVRIGGRTVIYNAIVGSMREFITFKNWWSSGRWFTWTRSNNKYKVGCFWGTGKSLIAKASMSNNPIVKREYERVVKYVESILEDEKR